MVCGESLVWVSMGSLTAIPDSRARWNAIWENREDLTEIVHTHPGRLLRFSHEDLTTMEAVESALGRPLRWSIVTDDGYFSQFDGKAGNLAAKPWWLPVLRELSFGRASARSQRTRKENNHVCFD